MGNDLRGEEVAKVDYEPSYHSNQILHHLYADN